MATTPEALPGTVASEAEREYIASQWRLMWWRFRRHKVALVSTVILAAFYVVALFPEFLAIHDPYTESIQRVNTPAAINHPAIEDIGKSHI